MASKEGLRMVKLKFDPAREYNIIEINHFSSIKTTHRNEANLAEKAVIFSRQNKTDNLEINKKIYKVLCAQGDEQIRQYVNLLCELMAYNEINKLGLIPHWITESNSKTPDIEYLDNGRTRLVEVKHINRPRVEDLALRGNNGFEINTEHDYYVYLEKQIKDKIQESVNKCNDYAKTLKRAVSQKAILYLFITPSLSASVLKDLDFRVKKILDDNVSESLDISFFNFQKYFETAESIRHTKEINIKFYQEIIRQFKR